MEPYPRRQGHLGAEIVSKEQALLLAGFLTVIGVQVGTLLHWHEVRSPGFISTTCLQLGILLRAIYTEKPQ
jgi:hypothetical protein